MTAKFRMTYQDIEVIPEDDPYEQGGIIYLPVRALEGKPFADGARSTTRTAFRTVAVSDLKIVREGTLLDRALEYTDKKQWASGEIVELWKGKGRSAWLKAGNGIVYLCVSGAEKILPVFMLDSNENEDGWEWHEVPQLEYYYADWVKQVNEGLK